MPISRVAQAKTGFHSVTSPFLRHFSATVFGRSNTHTSGAPPQLSRCCARLRTRLSTVSSFTTETRIQREYFRREAKKRMRRAVPSINSDVHLSEVVLAEFSRQTLKTNQGLDLLRPQGGHQRVKCALAPRVARSPNSPQDFHGRQVGLLLQDLDDGFPEILDDARPANPPLYALGGIIDMDDRIFFRDTLDGAQRNSRQTGHLDLRVASLQQDFNFVSLQHP